MEHIGEAAHPILIDHKASRLPTWRADPWRVLGIGAQVAVLLGMAGLASVVAGKLDASDERLFSEVRKTQALTTETAALTAKTDDLKHEVAKLRQFIASRTSEDVIFLKIMIAKHGIDRDVARDIAHHVHRYADLYGQDPDLVLAIMYIESRFDPNIVSYKGAQGLMQVMPQWSKVLGISEPLTDIETSVKYGLQILGFYREMYKDVEMALTAYNRGPGPVDMALMRGVDPKNGYAAKVLEKFEQLRALHVGKP